MTEMVWCSKGHKFPINRKKHTNRRYVMCPECGEKVKIRGWFRLPNPNWPKEKERIKSDRREMKEKKRRKGKGEETPFTFRL